MPEAALLEDLPEPDRRSGDLLRTRCSRVLRPTGALSRLDELAVWLAEWQRIDEPAVDRPAVAVFAADHGAATDGVSAYPAEITGAMFDALDKGAATASVMARQLGAAMTVVDVGVGEPTGNIRHEAAMSREQFDRAFDRGREVVSGLDCDLLVLGEMGIGNTTAASAVACAVLGEPVERMVGRGTGVDDAGLERKRSVVSEALARVGDIEPFEALRQLGGFELAAMCGAVLEARARSIPVVLDGFVVTSAAIPLELVAAGSLDHCWPGHVSPEPGHAVLLERLGRRPVLDLQMRLGEGSGALVSVPIFRLAAASVVDVATFEEWGLA